MTPPAVLHRMEQQLLQWEHSADRKAVFLGCYTMMTRNMHHAVEQGEFADAEWVSRLLAHFAEYYFGALTAYMNEPDLSHPVWRIAHDAAGNKDITSLQLLLLGVNAHINYDLVLALFDMLSEEWPQLDSRTRSERHADYCHVNAIIARTIDAVQDDILSPSMPVIGLIDSLMGRVDEMLISTLLTRWRDDVWQASLRLLDASDIRERTLGIQDVEVRVIERADMLAMRDWNSVKSLLQRATR